MRCRCGKKASVNRYGTSWCEECLEASERYAKQASKRFKFKYDLSSGHGKPDKYARNKR